MTKNLIRLTISIMLVLFACAPSFSQELLSVFPGVTVLRDRTIPSPVGVSPEMTDIITSRQMPPDFPLPTTTKGWLEFQKLFDGPGGELARQGAKHLGATYEVQEMAGVRTYVVTPKKINKRFADRVFVHVHGVSFPKEGVLHRTPFIKSSFASNRWLDIREGCPRALQLAG